MKKILIIFLFLFNIACTSTQGFKNVPDDWSGIITPSLKDCSDISGVYHVNGISHSSNAKLDWHHPKSGKPHSLKHALGLKTQARNITHLSITIKDQVLGVKLFNKTKLIDQIDILSIDHEKYAKWDKYNCLNNNLIIITHDRHKRALGDYYEPRTVHLYKTRQGELIAKFKYTAGSNSGGVMLFPSSATEIYYWYRFMPVKKGDVLKIENNST